MSDYGITRLAQWRRRAETAEARVAELEAAVEDWLRAFDQSGLSDNENAWWRPYQERMRALIPSGARSRS